MAVRGGLYVPSGDWRGEGTLTALVDARGVAGAVSGNSGGAGILTGSGNSDLRFCSLFFLDRRKKVECDVFKAGFLCSPVLSIERDEPSDSLPPTGRNASLPVMVGRSRAELVERRPGSS